MSRLFSSGSRKICASASNSRRNIAEKDARKQNSPQPPEMHEPNPQEGNVDHSAISGIEQESTKDNSRESTASILQTNVIGKESQTHCPEVNYLQGNDKCTSKENISTQRGNKMSNNALVVKVASNASAIQSLKECAEECTSKQNTNSLGAYKTPSNVNIGASVIEIQHPKELIDECTNKQNANSLREYQTPSTAITANVAASVSDIQRPKELIDECTNRPTLESNKASKTSSNALATNVAVTASGIQSPKESITECTSKLALKSNKANKASSNAFAASISVTASGIQSPKESITECSNRPTLESKRASKVSNNALAANVAATASDIQSPKECIDESTSRQSMNALKAIRNSSKALAANLGANYLDIQHPRELTFGIKQPGLTNNASKVNFEERSHRRHIGSRKMNASMASSEGGFLSDRKNLLSVGKLKVPIHDPMQQMNRFEELRRQGKSIAKSLDHQKKLDAALDRMKIEIPHSLELEIHEEASAIIGDLAQAYKKLLGRNHPLAIQAKEHISMIANTGRQRLPRVGILPTMIVENVDHEKVKIN